METKNSISHCAIQKRETKICLLLEIEENRPACIRESCRVVFKHRSVFLLHLNFLSRVLSIISSSSLHEERRRTRAAMLKKQICRCNKKRQNHHELKQKNKEGERRSGEEAEGERETSSPQDGEEC